MTASATSYSLYTGALPNALELTVNGMTYVATPNAINYGGTTVTSHVLGQVAIANAYGPANITASWRFNGVYSGVALNTITASGVAVF